MNWDFLALGNLGKLNSNPQFSSLVRVCLGEGVPGMGAFQCRLEKSTQINKLVILSLAESRALA